MVKFTKTQMTFLQRFEDNLRTAYRSDYVRAIPWEDISDVADLWNEVSGEGYQPDRGCASCTLTLFKKVGEAYFKQIESEENKPKKSKKNGK